jgi:hypothetical protein
MIAQRIKWLVAQVDMGKNMTMHTSFNPNKAIEKVSIKLFPGPPLLHPRPVLRESVQSLHKHLQSQIVTNHGHTHKGTQVSEVYFFFKLHGQQERDSLDPSDDSGPSGPGDEDKGSDGDNADESPKQRLNWSVGNKSPPQT